MAITPGARLGPYEIVSAMGAGGMGEVYKARDARLNRDVAIKILPAALAALNHPNIAAIYGIEEAAGGSLSALVMELVDGPSLDELIQGAGQPALPIADVLVIARQIAEALEAAHEALVDTLTGRWTPLAAPEGGNRYRLSGDTRTLLVERTILDADVWLMERK